MEKLFLCAVLLLALVFIATGCSNINLSKPTAEQTAAIAIETAAFSAGQRIAEKNPELVGPILSYYNSIDTGNISVADLNRGLSCLKIIDANPAYTTLLLRLASQVGMTVDLDDGKILGIVDMDDRYFAIAMDGFVSGLTLAADLSGET